MDINFQADEELLTSRLKGKTVSKVVFCDDCGEDIVVVVFQDNSELVISSQGCFKSIQANEYQ